MLGRVITAAALAVASVGAAAAPFSSSALADCRAGNGSFSVAPLACAGAFQGNLGGSVSAAQWASMDAAFAGTGWIRSMGSVYSKSDMVGNGVFDDLGSDNSLRFDDGQVAKGLFVIGLKQANFYSLYLFDGGVNGIGELSFDLKGVIDGAQSNGLSHAVYLGPALFVRPSGPNNTPNDVPGGAIPLPGSLALTALGLGLLAFRRRA